MKAIRKNKKMAEMIFHRCYLAKNNRGCILYYRSHRHMTVQPPRILSMMLSRSFKNSSLERRFSQATSTKIYMTSSSIIGELKNVREKVFIRMFNEFAIAQGGKRKIQPTGI